MRTCKYGQRDYSVWVSNQCGQGGAIPLVKGGTVVSGTEATRRTAEAGAAFP